VRRPLQTLAAFLAASLFLTSLFMWLRSYFADDQLQRTSVKTLSSRTQDIVYSDHIRLSSSWGRLTLGLMKTKTPHPPLTEPTISLATGPPVTRWHLTHLPDDLGDIRKKSKKWERRVVFEFGRVTSKLKPDPPHRILPGGQKASAYLSLPWPEVVFILGLIAYPLTRSELTRRNRPWRLLHGYCVHCGYDLRKSQSACPECGKGRWGLE
jgi:hypothetical protein